MMEALTETRSYTFINYHNKRSISLITYFFVCMKFMYNHQCFTLTYFCKRRILQTVKDREGQKRYIICVQYTFSKSPSKLTDLKDLALGNGVENKDINILLHTYSICMHKNFNKSCIILTNCYWSQTHRLQNVYWRPCFPRWW